MKIRTAKTVILLLAFVLAMSFSAWEGGRADAAMIDGYVYLGQIRLMVVDDAPSGWAKCNGQQFPIDFYPDLYAVLGTRFGGDGVNFFALPKLDSPVPGTSYYIAIVGQVPEAGVLSGFTVGQIELFPYAPPGWVPCNGAKLNKQYNTALFSLLGYSFGGEGNAFAIPDLRSAEPDENIHYYMALSG